MGANLFSWVFVWGKPAKRNRRMQFLLDMLRRKKYETAIVADGTVSSIPFRRLGPLFDNPRFIRLFSFFEIYAWCLINGINPFRQTILFSAAKLDPVHDILFGFAYLQKTFSDDALLDRSAFTAFSGKKLLHATHFYEHTELVAKNVQKAGVKAMVAEVDVRQSPYFKAHFGFVDAVYILPFALRSRYRATRNFMARTNKCVALGTLAFFPDDNPPTAGHFAFFNTNTLHPMRKTIFDNATRLLPVIDSLIVAHKNNPVARKRAVWKIMWANINPVTKEYHSFDIVETYNTYRMFVSPEETIGQPSINTIEGMACGCAYVGIASPMYEGMGMVQGVHYVAYDGTLDGLVRMIGHYQARPDELARIAEAGRALVTERFKPDTALYEFARNSGII